MLHSSLLHPTNNPQHAQCPERLVCSSFAPCPHAGQHPALSLCTFPEATVTFSGSQTLHEHLALPEPCQIYNIQQARDAPQVEYPGGFCKGLLMKQGSGPEPPKACDEKIRAQGQEGPWSQGAAFSL